LVSKSAALEDPMTNARIWLTTGLLAVWLAAPSALGARSTTPGDALSTPEITNVTPAAPGLSTKPQRLAVAGTDFLEGLTLMITTPGGQSLRFGGADIQNRRQGSFEVDAVLDAKGNYSLVVTNQDGGVSRPFVVTVQAPAKRPTIDSVTPAKVTKSNSPQILTVRGSLFEAGLTVFLTDPTGTVKTLSGNAIADVTPSSFQFTAILELAGEYSVEVKLASGAVSNTSVIVAE
jgi:hypothetical protein